MVEGMASSRRIIAAGEITTSVPPQLCAPTRAAAGRYNPNRLISVQW